MNRIAIAVVLFAWVSLAAAQSLPNLSTFGFSAEPGASIGTPCVVNAVARFWYRNFGVSTCGMYLPSALGAYVSSTGFEGDLMYRFALRGFQGVLPYLGVGAGTSSINLTSGQWVFRAVNPGYVCAHVGAYYSSFYAQLGLGVGNFTISTAFRTPVFPVLQVGWTYSTASKTAAKTK